MSNSPTDRGTADQPVSPATSVARQFLDTVRGTAELVALVSVTVLEEVFSEIEAEAGAAAAEREQAASERIAALEAENERLRIVEQAMDDFEAWRRLHEVICPLAQDGAALVSPDAAPPPSPALDSERLAAVLPAAINFHFLPPRAVGDPIWRKIADDIAARLAAPPASGEAASR